jgi:NTP pyrophosphatase (non-canonical NTP hydrolase)
MDFDDFQKKVAETALYPGRGTDPTYPMIGLAGEVGEVAEHVKKALRDDGGVITAARREALLYELSDVLWYVSALADEFGFSLNDVAEANVRKLAGRKVRGTLQGSGSDR